MFVSGIHEHRDGKYPKRSTVERWNTSTIDSLKVIGGLISNTKIFKSYGQALGWIPFKPKELVMLKNSYETGPLKVHLEWIKSG